MGYLISLLLLISQMVINHFSADSMPEHIGEWHKDKEIKFFTPENLFDYINGDAERFIPYNFQELMVIFYKHKGAEVGEKVEIQIYRMASVLDAFGIYSVHRDRTKDVFPWGEDGFIGDTQAMFFQSRYFVKISISNGKGECKQVLKMFGKALSEVLPKEKFILKELECLDTSGKIPRSERYIARYVLSQEFFPKGIQVLFKTVNGEATGFVVFYNSGQDAKEGLNKYVRYLESISAEYRVEGNNIEVNEPKSENAIVTLVEDNLIGVWQPNAEIAELRRIHADIIKCFNKLKSD